MTDDELGAFLLASMARHQSRGVIYTDEGAGETVVHGRIDLAAVAAEVHGLVALQKSARSWPTWFADRVHQRRSREAAQRRQRDQSLASEAQSAAAIERLRRRAQDTD